MLIRCWGARGSIPVSGPMFSRYGGNTTCLEIRTGRGELIILDAGTGIQELGNRLREEKVSRIQLLLTHFHWDHLMGFPFFKPIYSKETRLDIYGPRTGDQPLEALLAAIMVPPFFPRRLSELPCEILFHEINESSFSIQSLEIDTIPLSHPNGGLGFRLKEENGCFVFLTDNELGMVHPGGKPFQDYVKFSRGADLLLHDAEFSGTEYELMKSWGHSSVDDALRLAMEAEVGRLGLFHHHQNRVDPDIDLLVRDCLDKIQRDRCQMDCFGVAEGMEIRI